MNKNNSWFVGLVLAGWSDVLIRTLKTFVIAMLVYHVKEYIDAGRFDTLELAIDSLWLAGGALIIETILMLTMTPKAKRAVPAGAK